MRPHLTVLALLLCAPAAARAETAVGFRVGGYGFREPHTQAGWNDCRMNGLGLFAERSLTPAAFFVETGLDAYFASDAPFAGAAGDETSMDRISALASVAGGVRPFADARVSPDVQLGLGVELTRVTAGGDAGSYVLPLAFLGLGGDVRLGRARLGAAFRLHAMGHFDRLAGGLSVAPELAAQLQFYAKVTL